MCVGGVGKVDVYVSGEVDIYVYVSGGGGSLESRTGGSTGRKFRYRLFFGVGGQKGSYLERASRFFSNHLMTEAVALAGVRLLDLRMGETPTFFSSGFFPGFKFKFSQASDPNPGTMTILTMRFGGRV